MEEVPDPRLGLTLSSDLIQDPPLLISFPTEGQRRQQFYWKSFQKGSCHAISLNILVWIRLDSFIYFTIQKDRAAVAGDAVYYIKQLVRTADELKQLVGRTKMKKCGVVDVNTKPTVLGSRYNHSCNNINNGSISFSKKLTDDTEIDRCSHYIVDEVII